MNVKFALIILFAAHSWMIDCASAQPAKGDPIAELIQKVNLDSMLGTVRVLSGLDSVNLPGSHGLILSRQRDYPGNELAASYLLSEIKKQGLQPKLYCSSPTCCNILATLQGTRPQAPPIILSAHYDSRPIAEVAPGADDNASGCAAVLEAVRILKAYRFYHDIIFAFWDEEEENAVGSATHAFQLSQKNKRLKGMISVDMIGYDADDDGKVLINTKDIGISPLMADLMVEVNEKVCLDMRKALNPT
ncbi:M20/M25/M40 family metallo-hydrolase [candidate division KSB1 bacterium]|nr:M20/M25/M40 family metallo-hydrolase [candidate division KSB1 bacterium]